MKKKNNKIQLIDVLGIIAYLLIAVSCFLPFLDYTTIAGVETVTYFQSNGKLVFIISIIAILVIYIKKFKYTIICLGLTIGVFAYDIVFGLLDVVREMTYEHSLKYGFYLIAMGMFINLAYIVLKKKSIDKESDDNIELEESSDSYISENQQNDSQLDDVQTTEDVIVDDIETLDILEKSDVDNEISSISIFNDTPDFSVPNNQIEGNSKQDDNNFSNNINERTTLVYKLCPKCGMQINYSDNQCPVCGQDF